MGIYRYRSDIQVNSIHLRPTGSNSSHVFNLDCASVNSKGLTSWYPTKSRSKWCNWYLPIVIFTVALQIFLCPLIPQERLNHCHWIAICRCDKSAKMIVFLLLSTQDNLEETVLPMIFLFSARGTLAISFVSSSKFPLRTRKYSGMYKREQSDSRPLSLPHSSSEQGVTWTIDHSLKKNFKFSCCRLAPSYLQLGVVAENSKANRDYLAKTKVNQSHSQLSAESWLWKQAGFLELPNNSITSAMGCHIFERWSHSKRNPLSLCPSKPQQCTRSPLSSTISSWIWEAIQ